MNKGVSIIVWDNGEMDVEHGRTLEDHTRTLNKILEPSTFVYHSECFSPYPDPPIPCEHCRGIDAHYADCSRATGN